VANSSGLYAGSPTVVTPADTVVKSVGTGGALKSKVHYSANDSTRFDIAIQKVYLFGSAQVEYEDIVLKAQYIELDLKNNIVFAKGGKDSLGKPFGTPLFSESGQEFSADSMTYNFKTKKGRISEVVTKQGDGFIHGAVVKKDTGDVYYIKHGLYTTCELKHPHYFIKAEKLKVIPEDKIITGPAYLVLGDVPTPLAVPFGYFPNKKGRTSGILIPTYGESEALGFFLKDGGYYFGISDNFDLALRGDIYSFGSWGLKTNSNYVKRYKYNGNVSINYSNILLGEKELPTSSVSKDFFVRWAHNQDGKARPGSRFSANVNAGSSTYNTFNSYSNYNPNLFLTNTFQSNIAYARTWQRSNLSVNARHSQNTINKKVDLSLPEVTYSVNRFYPFKGKNRVTAKWYDKIGISAVANAKNDISTYDSLLFKPNVVQKMNNGLTTSVPISTSFNILNYFNLNPSFTTTTRTYYKTLNKTYNPDTRLIETDTVNGFRNSLDYIASASLSTKLYGMYVFPRARIKAIRHVITPSLSASYRPDYSSSKYGYFQTVRDSSGNLQQYSIFQNGIYGGPSAGKSGLINYSINNNLEAKAKSKNDTDNTDRKITLIESFSVSQSYNLAADNFQWSVINMNARTRLFKSLDITAGAALDPYQVNEVGTRIEKFTWDKDNSIGRLTSANLSLGTNLRNIKKETVKKESSKGTEAELDYINANPDAYIDFNVPWSLNMYYNLQYAKPQLTETVSQSFSFSGDVSITAKWKAGFNSGFDLKTSKFTYTSLNIYRDLHCWEMAFSWVPFGERQSYSVTINVKSPVLQDLKLNKKKDWYDATR